MWTTIIEALAKAGSKAVAYAVEHKDIIIKIAKEISIQAAINYVLKKLGLA